MYIYPWFWRGIKTQVVPLENDAAAPSSEYLDNDTWELRDKKSIKMYRKKKVVKPTTVEVLKEELRHSFSCFGSSQIQRQDILAWWINGVAKKHENF